MVTKDELRGYLMGLEDGYVKSKLEGNDDKYLDMSEFDALHKQAQAFVDTKGEEFYRDYVATVNFNPDGTRSRGYFPADPNAAPRRTKDWQLQYGAVKRKLRAHVRRDPGIRTETLKKLLAHDGHELKNDDINTLLVYERIARPELEGSGCCCYYRWFPCKSARAIKKAWDELHGYVSRVRKSSRSWRRGLAQEIREAVSSAA